MCPNSNKTDATIKGRFEASFYCFSIQQTVTRKDSFPGIFPEQVRTMKKPIDWYSRRAGTFPAKTSIFSGRSVRCATYCTSALPIPRLTYAGLHMAMSVPHGNKRQIRITSPFQRATQTVSSNKCSRPAAWAKGRNASEGPGSTSLRRRECGLTLPNRILFIWANLHFFYSFISLCRLPTDCYHAIILLLSNISESFLFLPGPKFHFLKLRHFLQ